MASHLRTPGRLGVSESFESAAAHAGGTVERRFRVAGHLVEVRSAGPAAADWLDGPLGHLRADGDPTPHELTVLAWDGVGGAEFPLEPTITAAGTWQRGRSVLEYEAADDLTQAPPWRRVSGLLGDSRAVFWMASANELSLSERGAPLLSAFQRWLSDHQVWVVHAGAVAGPGGAAIVVGPGGVGKSSTCLACYEAGLDYLADDYLAVSLDSPTAHSIYRSAKLAWDHPAGVGRSLEPVNRRESGDEKALYLLADRVLTASPVRAIIVPRVSEGPPRLEPCGPAEALLSFAPSSVLQLTAEAQRRLAALRSLCLAVPCYRLSLGRDMQASSALVAELLGS